MWNVTDLNNITFFRYTVPSTVMSPRLSKGETSKVSMSSESSRYVVNLPQYVTVSVAVSSPACRIDRMNRHIRADVNLFMKAMEISDKLTRKHITCTNGIANGFVPANSVRDG